jgi:hypothetical protein
LELLWSLDVGIWSFSTVIRHSTFGIRHFPWYFSAVRYLVKAGVKNGKASSLLRAIDQKTLGRGSIAGDEYLHNMQQARLSKDGVATWVECCFCTTPLQEERSYWEDYFDLFSVKDAHSRRNCRHENGTEPWACCDCDCTKRLEAKLASQGGSFLETIRAGEDRQV